MDDMDTLVERLQQAGVRLTAQRRTIAEALDGEHRHLTADELLIEAQARVPEIGRATVYKALAAFVAAGAVREVHVGPGPTRFDPNAHIPHHHQICQRCEQIWDTTPAIDLPALTDPPFEAQTADIIIYGVCSTCRPR